MKGVKELFGLAVFNFLLLSAPAQNLEVAYDAPKGVSRISYAGHELLNLSKNIGASFAVESYKVIRKGGKVENPWTHHRGNSWNPADRTLNIALDWGTISCRYEQQKDTLLIRVTVMNDLSSDTIAGVSFCPLSLQTGKRPSNFQQYYPYYANNIQKPAVISADLDKLRIIVENPEVNKKVYVGLLEDNNTNGGRYRVWTGNWMFTGMQDFDRKSEIRLAPKQSYSYTVALKFTKPTTPVTQVASSTYRTFNSQNNLKVSWKDRRPIGALFLSSYDPAASSTNPRKWTFMTEEKVSINTSAGRALFEKKLLSYADKSIAILKQMNAQGMITWDIEGQQFPHPLSYIGSPEMVKEFAPEISAVLNTYFRKFTRAGFKAGICLRPDSVVWNKERTWINHIPVKDPAADLIRKIKFARKKWGCTIFYIDSNVDPKGNPMDASVFMKVQQACPDVLLIPEHESLQYFRYTVPYGEMRQGTLGVSEEIKAVYPGAFMVVNTADGVKGNGKDVVRKLADMITAGNILLFRAWFNDQPTNSAIQQAMDLRKETIKY